MEKTLRKSPIPSTDSIKELAAFWDTHDSTDFEHQMVEVPGPILVRAKGASLNIVLPPADVKRLKGIARSMGVKETTVVRKWIIEKLRTARER